ncbi:molybdenum cofactor guanylyltransferase [Candidatus Bathyarchaeota archaeon]|nr:molybdenum cofactor guanylyltransferase [Candidatus Bathyarchaeota archaeon]
MVKLKFWVSTPLRIERKPCLWTKRNRCALTRSGIVLAGGSSTRLGEDKGLCLLAGKPLVNHIVDKIRNHIDEVIVVVASEEQKEKYGQVVEGVVMDMHPEGSPLIGLLTGLSRCKGEYALAVACDMPFICDEAVEMLFAEAEGRDGAVFEKPNGWIEPLVAVYNVETTLREAERLYREGDLRVRMIFLSLDDVSLIPVDQLRSVDPELYTFFDTDTEDRFCEADRILKTMSKK